MSSIRNKPNTQDFTHNNRNYKRRVSNGQPVFDIYVAPQTNDGGGTTVVNNPAVGVTTGDNPPSNPTDGDLWYDTTKAQLHVYTSALPGWIQANGGTGGGAGPDLSGLGAPYAWGFYKQGSGNPGFSLRHSKNVKYLHEFSGYGSGWQWVLESALEWPLVLSLIHI